MTPYYDDGTCVIYHGDCREVMSCLAFDAVITDPPYGTDHSAISGDDDFPHDVLPVEGPSTTIAFASAKRLTADVSAFATPPDRVLVWAPPFVWSVQSTHGVRVRWTPIYVWHPMQTGRGEPHGDVFTDFVGGRESRKVSTVTKPVSLMRRLFPMTAGVVLDPFMGSGTTLRAAKDLGRRAIGIEIEERYCEIAAKRLAQEVLDFA